MAVEKDLDKLLKVINMFDAPDEEGVSAFRQARSIMQRLEIKFSTLFEQLSSNSVPNQSEHRDVELFESMVAQIRAMAGEIAILRPVYHAGMKENEELANLRKGRDAQIVELKSQIADLKATIQTLGLPHEQMLSRLQSQHASEIRSINARHQQEVTSLRQAHAETESALASQRTENEELKSANGTLQLNASNAKMMGLLGAAIGVVGLIATINSSKSEKEQSSTQPAAVATTEADKTNPSTELKKPGQAEGDQSYKVGQLVEDKGVYLGARDRVNGITKVSETWNYFAAPKDLTDDKGQRLTASYTIALVKLRVKKDFFGHSGENIDADKLGQAFDNRTYKGGWFIDNISGVQDQVRKSNIGSLKGTYKISCADNDISCHYWSSTVCAGAGAGALAMKMKESEASCWTQYAQDNTLSVRPVRAELVAASPKR